MMNLTPIKSGLEKLFDEYSQRNIKLMFSFKMIQDQFTDDLCVAFIVDKKLPINELSEQDIIPSYVIVDNKKYMTDVIEFTDVHVLADSCNAWQTIPPGNRNTVRPLKGGISISSKNYASSSPCNVGTLGFIAVDKQSQALVGVTCAHVVVGDSLSTSYRSLSGIIQNDKDNYVYQNGETCTVNPALQIGQVIRYVPLNGLPDIIYPEPQYFNFIKNNLVDGALISLKESDISNTESFKQYGVNYNLPLPFATSTEIDSLAVSRPNLYVSARTTGVKGDEPCVLVYQSTFTQGNLLVSGFKSQGQNLALPFNNIIIFRTNDSRDPSSAPGDSGAALIADFNGVRKIIGLIFGQGLYGNIITGLACRIDLVARELGIEAWDGTPKNFIDPASIAYTTVPGKSYQSAIKRDGKIYWQIGLTNN